MNDQSPVRGAAFSGAPAVTSAAWLAVQVERFCTDLTRPDASAPARALGALLDDWGRRFDAIEPSGYVPYFERLGSSPAVARLQAAAVRHFARRYHEQHQDERVALKAFHRLARRQRWHPALIKQVIALNDNGWDFGFLDSAFGSAGCPELKQDFVDGLQRSCVDADAHGPELMVIVKRIAPYAPSGRGRPISLKTMQHRTLLRWSEYFGRRQAYTYEFASDDFVDAATKATRLEIGDADFNPMAAWRLAKALRKDEDHASIGNEIRGNG